MKFAEQVLRQLGSTIAVYVCLSTGMKSKGGRQGSRGRNTDTYCSYCRLFTCSLRLIPLLCFFCLLNTDILCCQRNAYRPAGRQKSVRAHTNTHAYICIYLKTHKHLQFINTQTTKCRILYTFMYETASQCTIQIEYA